MNLDEFKRRLSRHDWFYQYSDDGAVWRRGNSEEEVLRHAATLSPKHEAEWDKWSAYARDPSKGRPE